MVVIGAPEHDALAQEDGVVCLIGSRDFENVGSFELSPTAGEKFSFKFIGERARDRLGDGVNVDDVDGDAGLLVPLLDSRGRAAFLRLPCATFKKESSVVSVVLSYSIPPLQPAIRFMRK